MSLDPTRKRFTVTHDEMDAIKRHAVRQFEILYKRSFTTRNGVGVGIGEEIEKETKRKEENEKDRDTSKRS